MEIIEIFSKDRSAGRRGYIVRILENNEYRYMSRFEIAAELWQIYNGALAGENVPEFPIKKADFYKSHAARVITADIAAINAEPRNFCTIIHNGCGVKLQSRAEAEIWLKAQFRETLGKLNHLKDIARKNGLDGQEIMGSPDVISAYID